MPPASGQENNPDEHHGDATEDHDMGSQPGDQDAMQYPDGEQRFDPHDHFSVDQDDLDDSPQGPDLTYPLAKPTGGFPIIHGVEQDHADGIASQETVARRDKARKLGESVNIWVASYQGEQDKDTVHAKLTGKIISILGRNAIPDALMARANPPPKIHDLWTFTLCGLFEDEANLLTNRYAWIFDDIQFFVAPQPIPPPTFVATLIRKATIFPDEEQDNRWIMGLICNCLCTHHIKLRSFCAAYHDAISVPRKTDASFYLNKVLDMLQVKRYSLTKDKNKYETNYFYNIYVAFPTTRSEKFSTWKALFENFNDKSGARPYYDLDVWTIPPQPVNTQAFLDGQLPSPMHNPLLKQHNIAEEVTVEGEVQIEVEDMVDAAGAVELRDSNLSKNKLIDKKWYKIKTDIRRKRLGIGSRRSRSPAALRIPDDTPPPKLYIGSSYQVGKNPTTVNGIFAPMGSGMPDPVRGNLTTLETPLRLQSGIESPLRLRGGAPDNGDTHPQDDTSSINSEDGNDLSGLTSPQHRTNSKKVKRSLKVASINMRGGGSIATAQKWQDINGLMRENNIAILAVQETHIDAHRLCRLESLFERQLLIKNSADSLTLNGRAVSIILNKRFTLWKDATFNNIVLGRALLLHLPWGERGTLNILAIYAPNDQHQNMSFWKDLTKIWKDRALPRLDILLGDFNSVEDPLDRQPPRKDPTATVEALQEFKAISLLQDGWRQTYPDKTFFTWTHGPTESRLDRKGRWAIPLMVTENKEFIRKIIEKGMHLQETLHEQASPRPSLQMTFANFKKDVIKLAKQYASKTASILDKQIEQKKAQLDEALCNQSLGPLEKEFQSAIKKGELRALVQLRHQKKKWNIAIRNKLEGETISKYWIGLNKDRAPRTTIYALRNNESSGPEFIHKSVEMAEIARRHHYNGWYILLFTQRLTELKYIE
ncbi:hypothetical protein M422DRAFT_253260 [Sphaerobolus stellatus SS14]|uniref:Endonuclease/exonuclease/phosphatase domain-containing protein n=1 Tax=Sphaerobolus stellatus (strain SS14) TaxID=990650 RepID=A0A0C9VX26_SPHS4|nr:hypothetical protein M422DRAFT_253260 [Sphaerobolus stellatus SS14]